MLRPADIADRDFLVVVHGYHKGEVHDFLAHVANAYRELLDQVEARDDGTGRDDFESMGTEIASVLRAAKDAATAMTEDADTKLAEAEALLVEARREADELRTQAAAALGEAQESARRIQRETEERSQQSLREADERAQHVLRDAEERAQAHRIEAEAGVRTRLDALHQHEQAIRDRLEHLSAAVADATGSLDESPVTHLDLEAAALQ